MKIILVILAFAPGLAGFLFPPGEWYRELKLPPAVPPDWVFPAVWLLLYALIALGAVLAAEAAPKSGGRFPWAVFLLQGLLNFLWPLIFFGRQNPVFALVELPWLILAAGVLTAKFFRLRPAAGLLLLPYPAWCLFAFYLNYQICLLNVS